jgi:hypothetical protein
MNIIVNVGTFERWLAAVAGVALLVSVFVAWSPWRLVGAILLFYRAISGNCKAYELCGINTCKIKPKL